jgi:transposase
MLAELVDAVVGVDTHRDSHEVEIALPTGIAIGTRKISNDDCGFAELLAWIVQVAPGPRVVVSIEGTRSYGVGLARAVAAAGLTVVECEQPNRQARRGRGKADPIDAHLAVLAALRLALIGYPRPAPMVIARRCGSCLVRVRSSPWSPPPRSTGSVRCCWAGTTRSGIWLVRR